MNRPAGVSVPQSQNQVAGQQETRGQPRTLMSIQKLETFGIQYADNTGAVHTALAHKMGDAVYVHPSDEQWASTIRSASGWLAQAVRDKIAEHAALEAIPAASLSIPDVDVAPPKVED